MKEIITLTSAGKETHDVWLVREALELESIRVRKVDKRPGETMCVCGQTSRQNDKRGRRGSETGTRNGRKTEGSKCVVGNVAEAREGRGAIWDAMGVKARR